MASAEEQGKWLEALERGWRRELSAQRRTVEEGWDKPLAERLAAGHALAGLRVKRVSGETVVVTADGEPGECRLREGDFVCLSEDRPWVPHGRFIHLGENEEGLHLWRWRGEMPADGVWVLDRDHVDLSDRYAEATEALAGTELGRGRILPLLMAESGGEVDGELFDRLAGEMETEVRDGVWDDPQAEAAAACVAARDAYLVQGPPGTGKTRVLAEAVGKLVERGERVLVTGPTHRAIHHALERCRQRLDAGTRVVKVGPTMLTPSAIEGFESFAESGLAEATGPYVVGATPFALWSSYTGLRETEFDVVVIDEASQVTVMVAVMAMLRGERWLFFGDDRQLPPVVLEDDGRRAVERSVFRLLKGRNFETMLELTWRLNEELAEWPSATFYGNRLRVKHDRRLALSPAQEHPALAAGRAAVLVTCGGRSGRVRSDAEAQQVVDVVRGLACGGVRAEEIGVVTPFRAQAARVRQVLGIASAAGGLEGRVVADTVERFQGQEREVMVVTLAASEPRWVRRMADFLFQPERWNVVVTRARKKLVVVVSEGLLATVGSLAEEGHEGAVCFSSWVGFASGDAEKVEREKWNVR